MRMWLTIAIGVAVAGCADQDAACAVSYPGPVTSMLDGRIDMVSGGGSSGAGDGSALHIAVDGTVTRTTKAAGTMMFRLDGPTIDTLRTQITAAQFPALTSSYYDVPDDFTWDLSVDIEGTTYRVSVGTLTTRLPARLSTLITRLRYVLTQPICN